MPVSVCRNCGKEARRIITVFEKAGQPLSEPQDQCEHCAPSGLHEEPAWLRHKPVPTWESRPHLYRKTEGAQGEIIYQPTDENLADLEAQLSKPCDEDVAAMEAQRNRQVSLPQDEDGMKDVMARADRKAREFLQHFQETTDEYNRQMQQYWEQETEDLRVQ